MSNKQRRNKKREPGPRRGGLCPSPGPYCLHHGSCLLLPLLNVCFLVGQCPIEALEQLTGGGGVKGCEVTLNEICKLCKFRGLCKEPQTQEPKAAMSWEEVFMGISTLYRN